MSQTLKLNGLTQHDGAEVRFRHYVTLDWDNHPQALMDALKHTIRKAGSDDGPVLKAWIRNSTMKEQGFHVIIELDRDYPTWVLYFLREWFGDDPNRIRWDKKRRDPHGVLFDYKRGHFAGPWTRFK